MGYSDVMHHLMRTVFLKENSMLNARIEKSTLMVVVNSLVNGGFLSDDAMRLVINNLVEEGLLSDQAIRVMVINLVNGVFEDSGAESLRLINCIKAVRNCTNLGLLEAKQFVERYKETSDPMVNVSMLIRQLENLRDGADRQWIGVCEGNDQVAGATNVSMRVNVDLLKQGVIDHLIDHYNISF
jgi:hypothetical protein